jgi:uncharacterized membrane protein YadS
MPRMRGGNATQAFLGWLISVFIVSVCVYFAINYLSETGRTTAIVFAVIFGIMVIGMPFEAYGMWKQGILFDN